MWGLQVEAASRYSYCTSRTNRTEGFFFFFLFLYPRKRYHYAKGPQRLYGNSTDGIDHVVLNVTIKKDISFS